jgi:L-amino acid N-acyltransferase YncA
MTQVDSLQTRGMTITDANGGLSTKKGGLDCIRRLKIEDAVAVARIYNAAVAGGESVYRSKSLDTTQVLEMLFSSPPRFECFGFENSDGLVGWSGLLQYHEREAYQTTARLVAYVALDQRRQGIARALVRHALGRADELAFHTVVLMLQKRPAYLLAWAARLGFRNTGYLAAALPVDSEWRDILIFQRFIAATQGAAQ